MCYLYGLTRTQHRMYTAELILNKCVLGCLGNNSPLYSAYNAISCVLINLNPTASTCTRQSLARRHFPVVTAEIPSTKYRHYDLPLPTSHVNKFHIHMAILLGLVVSSEKTNLAKWTFMQNISTKYHITKTMIWWHNQSLPSHLLIPGCKVCFTKWLMMCRIECINSIHNNSVPNRMYKFDTQ